MGVIIIVISMLLIQSKVKADEDEDEDDQLTSSIFPSKSMKSSAVLAHHNSFDGLKVAHNLKRVKQIICTEASTFKCRSSRGNSEQFSECFITCILKFHCNVVK